MSGYRASPALEAFILQAAGEFEPVDRDTLPEVQLMIDTGREPDVMPVWSGGSEQTIYSGPRMNQAFRSWHDRLHIRLGAAFNADGEFRLAIAHMHEASKAGLTDEDARALYFDVWGQFVYSVAHGGQFPADQSAFIAECFRVGIYQASKGNY